MKYHIILAFCWISSSLAAVEPGQFRGQASLDGEIHEELPARVTLTAELISRTHNRFADLRVFDDRNQEIPYVLYTKALPGETRKVVNLEPVKYEPLDNGGERLTFKRPKYFPAIEGMRAIVDGIDFEKTIQIETSNDGKTWQALAKSSIFDYSSRINLHNYLLETPTTDALYIRLTVSGEKTAAVRQATEDVSIKYKELEFRSVSNDNKRETKKSMRINGIEAWCGKTVQERQVLDETTIAISGESLDEKGNTVVDLGNCNLPLLQLKLDVATKYFYRNVMVEQSRGGENDPWYKVGSGTIYRIPGVNRANTKIQLDGIQYSHLRLVIMNLDNAPLKISAVSGSFLQRNLFLLPEPDRHYTLYFDSPNTHFPNYDLPSVLPENSPALEQATTLAIKEVIHNPLFNEKRAAKSDANAAKDQTKYIWLFRGLVIVLAGVLAFWAFRTLKNIK